MAFATVDDLASRWRVLSPSEIDRATALLDDAAIYLQAEFRRCNKEIDPEDEFLASALKIVSCSMVKRVLASSGTTALGIDGDFTQLSKTAGSFTEQYTFANPSGDMYITAREYRLLGIPQNSTRITQIGPAIQEVDNEG